MEIQLVKANKWFYRLVSLGNNKTIMTSQVYKTKWFARKQAKRIADTNGFQYIEIG